MRNVLLAKTDCAKKAGRAPALAIQYRKIGATIQAEPLHLGIRAAQGARQKIASKTVTNAEARALGRKLAKIEKRYAKAQEKAVALAEKRTQKLERAITRNSGYRVPDEKTKRATLLGVAAGSALILGTGALAASAGIDGHFAASLAFIPGIGLMVGCCCRGLSAYERAAAHIAQREARITAVRGNWEKTKAKLGGEATRLIKEAGNCF